MLGDGRIGTASDRSGMVDCTRSRTSPRGRSTASVMVVPCPSRLCIFRDPPINSASLREMVRPKPVPPKRRVVLASC